MAKATSGSPQADIRLPQLAVAVDQHRPPLLQAAQVQVQARDEALVEAHPRAEPLLPLPHRQPDAVHQPLPPGPLTRT